MPPGHPPLAGRVPKLGRASVVAEAGRGYGRGRSTRAELGGTPLLAPLRRSAASCATSSARGGDQCLDLAPPQSSLRKQGPNSRPAAADKWVPACAGMTPSDRRPEVPRSQRQNRPAPPGVGDARTRACRKRRPAPHRIVFPAIASTPLKTSAGGQVGLRCRGG